MKKKESEVEERMWLSEVEIDDRYVIVSEGSKRIVDRNDMIEGCLDIDWKKDGWGGGDDIREKENIGKDDMVEEKVNNGEGWICGNK